MAALMLSPAAVTDVGRVRPDNEDAVFTSPRIVVVADGVGGAAAGEIASRTALNAVIHLDKCRLDDPLDAALRRTVDEGNEAIAFVGRCRPALSGMATTLTAVALDDEGYVVANVGDSRAYLLRGGTLRQLTRDDSLVQELIETGRLTDAGRRDHPYRSIVTQALDGRSDLRPSVERTAARAGDRVLVCSDGLTDLVDDDVIAATLRTEPTPDACAARLVALANLAGGRDNVTAAVADVVPRRDATLSWA